MKAQFNKKEIAPPLQPDIIYRTAFWNRIKSDLGWMPIDFEKTRIRHNVGLVKRQGVRIFRTGEKRLPFFYDLHKTTAERYGFRPPPYHRFQALFSRHARHAEFDLFLLFTNSGIAVPSGKVETVSGRRATYLFRALSGEKRNMTGAYALRLAIIQVPERKDCLVYDMEGAAPVNEFKHACFGLYRFTTRVAGNYSRDESADRGHESLLIVSRK